MTAQQNIKLAFKTVQIYGHNLIFGINTVAFGPVADVQEMSF